MSDYIIQGATLTAIADAIRSKTGGTGKLDPANFASAISGIETGSGGSSGGDSGGSGVAGGADIDALIDRSVAEIASNSVNSIGDYAFIGCAALTKASFLAATGVGKSAFADCIKLVSVEIPQAKTIGATAFEACRKLTTPAFPLVTSIGDSAFSGCESMASADFQSAKSIGTRAFETCAGLVSANFPLATSIGSNAFDGCDLLANVNIPLVKTISSSTFRYCSGLVIADLPAATSISTYAFRYCENLTALILRSGTMCSLSNVNAFNGTPIESGTGNIYVPSALVDSYKAASKWSTYAAQFRALEDYTVDGTTTGALDESKI